MNLLTHILLLFPTLLASALPTETSSASLANMSDVISTWDLNISEATTAISPDFDIDINTDSTDTAPLDSDSTNDDTPNLTKRCGNCYPNRRLTCAKLGDGHIVILRCMVDCWTIIEKGKLAKELCKDRV